MATAPAPPPPSPPPVKSQPLHNFSFPFLKWGGKNHTNANHRFRRPVSAGDSSSSSQAITPLADHSSEPDSEPETRAHRVGSRTARNRFGFPSCYPVEQPHKQHQQASERVSNNNHETDHEAGERQRDTVDAQEAEPRAEAETEETVHKPWNLRPRKPVFSRGTLEIGVGASRNGGELQETTVHAVTAVHHSVHHGENSAQPKSLRLRGFAEMQCTERKEKRKFWIALSREEIEEDIFVMTGSRPARRPRKRPKNVQKQIDGVFPGLWLVGITADAYRVADTPSKR